MALFIPPLVAAAAPAVAGAGARLLAMIGLRGAAAGAARSATTAAAPGAVKRVAGALGLDSVGGVVGAGAGAFAPGIIDTLASSKTPEEAATILGPLREGKVAQLVGRGMRRDEAQVQVDQEMQQAIQEKMQEGSLPEIVGVALSIIGSVAGARLGGKLGKKAPDAPVSTTPPGTNMGKLGKESAPGTKLAPGLLRPFSPTAGQRGIGAKSDGLIEELDKAPTVSALERRPGGSSLERKPFKQDRGQEDVTRRRGDPLDDGSDMIEQRMPERGLIVPFSKFDADIQPPTRGRAPRPMREAEPISVRDSDEPLLLGHEPGDMAQGQARERAIRGAAERRAALDEIDIRNAIEKRAQTARMQGDGGQELVDELPSRSALSRLASQAEGGLVRPFRR